MDCNPVDFAHSKPQDRRVQLYRFLGGKVVETNQRAFF